ncbi:MAG: hypothetical protein HYV34_03070 [Candidatus Kerfeldbacteria bacterium]|nr:hypothetical protein [Candidatus Kerfeldbacteria bacterium]
MKQVFVVIHVPDIGEYHWFVREPEEVAKALVGREIEQFRIEFDLSEGAIERVFAEARAEANRRGIIVVGLND